MLDLLQTKIADRGLFCLSVSRGGSRGPPRATSPHRLSSTQLNNKKLSRFSIKNTDENTKKYKIMMMTTMSMMLVDCSLLYRPSIIEKEEASICFSIDRFYSSKFSIIFLIKCLLGFLCTRILFKLSAKRYAKITDISLNGVSSKISCHTWSNFDPNRTKLVYM